MKFKTKGPQWVSVFSSKHWQTYKLKVPGGWLYRHASTLTEGTNQVTGEKYPIQMAETMCFVPSVPRKI